MGYCRLTFMERITPPSLSARRIPRHISLSRSRRTSLAMTPLVVEGDASSGDQHSRFNTGGHREILDARTDAPAQVSARR